MLAGMSEQLVRSFFEAVSSGDLDAAAEHLADDVVLEFPGRRFGGRFEGRRRVMAFFKGNRRLFREPLRFDVSRVVASGDRAVAQWTNRGVTRDGRDYANRGATAFRITAARIAGIDDYLDTEVLAETWPA